MKILHIVAGVWPGSGIAEVLAGLCRALKAQGHEVCIAHTQENCLNALLPHYRLRFRLSSNGFRFAPTSLIDGQVHVKVFKRSFPKFLYFSWGMAWGLGKEVREADTVHVHGCWTFPVWWGAWLALRHKKTLVMSPHGSFNPLQLQHSAWKKRLVGWIDRWLLRRASVIHATCEAENAWVQAFVGKVAVGSSSRQLEEGKNIEHSTLNIEHPIKKKPRIVVIPNGVGE